MFYSCRECDSVFKSLESLQRHNRYKHGERVECEFCCYKCPRNAEHRMGSHYRAKHPGCHYKHQGRRTKKRQHEAEDRKRPCSQPRERTPRKASKTSSASLSEKRTSAMQKDFFACLVKFLQQQCREVGSQHCVEVSGYLTLEIDGKQRARYIISELVNKSGPNVSESFCSKLHQTFTPPVEVKSSQTESRVEHQVSSSEAGLTVNTDMSHMPAVKTERLTPPMVEQQPRTVQPVTYTCTSRYEPYTTSSLTKMERSDYQPHTLTSSTCSTSSSNQPCTEIVENSIDRPYTYIICGDKLPDASIRSDGEQPYVEMGSSTKRPRTEIDSDGEPPYTGTDNNDFRADDSCGSDQQLGLSLAGTGSLNSPSPSTGSLPSRETSHSPSISSYDTDSTLPTIAIKQEPQCSDDKELMQLPVPTANASDPDPLYPTRLYKSSTEGREEHETNSTKRDFGAGKGRTGQEKERPSALTATLDEIAEAKRRCLPKKKRKYTPKSWISTKHGGDAGTCKGLLPSNMNTVILSGQARQNNTAALMAGNTSNFSQLGQGTSGPFIIVPGMSLVNPESKSMDCSSSNDSSLSATVSPGQVGAHNTSSGNQSELVTFLPSGYKPTVGDNVSTIKKTHSHANLLQDFLKKSGDERPFHEIPPAELDSIMGLFFSSLRKEDGTEYTASYLRNIQCSLDRYLRWQNYGASISRDSAFRTSQRLLQSKQVDLYVQNHENSSKGPSIEIRVTSDLHHLYEPNALGTSSPESLLNSLCLTLCDKFGIQGAAAHHAVQWGDVVLLKTSEGLEYLQYNGPIVTDCVKPVVFALDVQSDRCPVQQYKVYKQRRPDDFSLAESPFYLSVKAGKGSSAKDDFCWFNKKPIGIARLGVILENLSKLLNSTANQNR